MLCICSLALDFRMHLTKWKLWFHLFNFQPLTLINQKSFSHYRQLSNTIKKPRRMHLWYLRINMLTRCKYCHLDHLPVRAHAEGMTSYLRAKNIPIFDISSLLRNKPAQMLSSLLIEIALKSSLSVNSMLYPNRIL